MSVLFRGRTNRLYNRKTRDIGSCDDKN